MKKSASKRKLSVAESQRLIDALKRRFAEHMQRHAQIHWSQVEARLASCGDKLWSLNEMESSGGEPDVVALDTQTGEYHFVDCSAESPTGRRSVCYDRAGLDLRKQHKPQTSAVDMAAEMGIELLTEEQYRQLQQLGEFDCKTSSWLKTPPDIRALGGAVFGDRRFGRVFVYHNGAQSYYGGRAFRGLLTV